MFLSMANRHFASKWQILVILGVAANFGRLLQSLPVASNHSELISKCGSVVQMLKESMELIDASI